MGRHPSVQCPPSKATRTWFSTKHSALLILSVMSTISLEGGGGGAGASPSAPMPIMVGWLGSWCCLLLAFVRVGLCRVGWESGQIARIETPIKPHGERNGWVVGTCLHADASYC